MIKVDTPQISVYLYKSGARKRIQGLPVAQQDGLFEVAA